MANYPYFNPYAYNPTSFQMPRPEYAQNGPQMPPQPTQSTAGVNGQVGFSCRPVTSKEEAMAVQVDFFGPGTIMPDLGHGVVYFKRFNQQTGACDIFEFISPQAKPEEPVKYATIADLNALRAELMQERKAVKNNDTDE